MQKVIVVGLGEVGRPLFDLVRESGCYQVSAIDLVEQRVYDAKIDFPATGAVDVLLLCFPCENRESFVKIALGYIASHMPRLVIVNSSVSPGTTRSIWKKSKSLLVAYSPIRGMPKNDMKVELKRWDKFVAGVTRAAQNEAEEFFRNIGLLVHPKKDVTALEIAKLLETTYRAVMIAAFQEFHRLCIINHVSLADGVEMIGDDDICLLDKPVMYPDVIGGTCLMPNLELLLNDSSCNSELLAFVKKSNEARKEEINFSTVRDEVKAIKILTILDEQRRQEAHWHAMMSSKLVSKKKLELWEPKT
jgi:UDP-N-acetyl-D-mannosaminuronate dehydrogenase